MLFGHLRPDKIQHWVRGKNTHPTEDPHFTAGEVHSLAFTPKGYICLKSARKEAMSVFESPYLKRNTTGHCRIKLSFQAEPVASDPAQPPAHRACGPERGPGFRNSNKDLVSLQANAVLISSM